LKISNNTLKKECNKLEENLESWQVYLSQTIGEPDANEIGPQQIEEFFALKKTFWQDLRSSIQNSKMDGNFSNLERIYGQLKEKVSLLNKIITPLTETINTFNIDKLKEDFKKKKDEETKKEIEVEGQAKENVKMLFQDN